MRLWMLLLLLGGVGFAASAETILVCHSQELPAAPGRPQVENALVETVFDDLFNGGEVAFDLLDTSDSTDEPGRLQALGKTYGADKVVWFKLIWTLSGDTLTLKEVDYHVLTVGGLTLAQGRLDGGLEIPSPQEKLQLKALQETFKKQLDAAWQN